MSNAVAENYIVILYDGDCGFCNHWVQWILGHKPSEKMRFVALQSDIGKDLLMSHDIEFDLKTIVVAYKDKSYQKAQAIFFVLSNLNSPLRYIGRLFGFLPRFVTSPFYDLVARHRHDLASASSTCKIPLPEQRKYFL